MLFAHAATMRQIVVFATNPAPFKVAYCAGYVVTALIFLYLQFAHRTE